MILTYQYRLLPTKRQHEALEQLLESQWLLYNAALQERIGAYQRGVFRTYFDQTKALTEWRRDDPGAAAFPLSIQRATLKRLDDAYRGFLRRISRGESKAGFPRFRGKGWWDTFGFREFEGITFNRGVLRFKGMPGGLKIHLHRQLPDARLRSCHFHRDAKGWKVGFALDAESAAPRPQDRCIGVDVGITTFAALSDGSTIPSLRAARRWQRKVRVAQRAVARKKPGSRCRRNARAKLARFQHHIRQRRLNHLHQASAKLVREHDLIAVESLNLKGLAQSALGRDVYDASWGKFFSLLRYKAERAGAQVVEVNPRNTSQNCSGCGKVVVKTR